MILILIMAAFVVGVVFGGWLRGEANCFDHLKPYRWQYRNAWETYVGIRHVLVVFGCGLVGHRWKQDTGCDEMFGCERCGKADWFPAKAPSKKAHNLYLYAMRLRGDGLSLWDGPRRRIEEDSPTIEPTPNLLTEFGIPNE